MLRIGFIGICLVVALACSADSVANAQRKKAQKVAPPTRNQHYQRKEFTNKDGSKLVYFLMTPKDYDATQKYALVLALHGRGGHTVAADVLGGEKMRDSYHCFVMAPMSPRPSSWASRRGSQNTKIPVVLQAVESLQKEVSIDPDRIYVTGQSMGGVGSFGAVAAKPHLFAAAVPVCGGWEPSQAKTMTDVPFWIFHGAEDKVVPTSLSQNMVNALTEAGAKPKYTEYPGVKHNSWTKAYATRDMWKWLFAQRRAVPKPASQESPSR